MALITPKSTTRKRFIVAESDGLVLETIQTYNKQYSNQQLRLFKLKGTWRANEYNELVFEAAGRKGKACEWKEENKKYTFKGSWKLNNNQQIEYLTGSGRDTLTFKGHWQILSTKKLVYILEGSSKSRFEFRAHLESASMRPKKGEIRYRIGIGARQRSKASPKQLLILYGEWKFSRNLGLSFNIDYGQGRVQAVEWGAEVTFSRNKVHLALRNELNKPLGITLTLTRQLFKSLDAKAYLKLATRRKEHSMEAGVTIPF